MSKFLEDFLITMPATQRKKLLELLQLKQQEGIIKSKKEFELELERLLQTLNNQNGKPTFEPQMQVGKTSSEKHNQNMEAIAFDLDTLFDASNQIERLLADHQLLSRSLLNELKKKIEQMKAKVTKYKLMIQNSDKMDDVIIENFKSPTYTETDESVLELYRYDRFGQKKESEFNAENYGHSIQLAGIESVDQLKTTYGKKLAKIEIINRIGLVASNNKYKVENAIDGSPDTFWAESILVDEPIIQNIDDLWSHDYHDYPKSGAICEIEITLNGLSTVSEIYFDPYCNYPLEIVAIHGYEKSDKSGKMYVLVSPNHENIYQRSQKSTDRMVFQFPSVEITKLRILIRQENYTKENFLVNVDEKNNTELWDTINSDEQLIQDFVKPGETIAEFDRKNEITGWNVYLKKLKEWATIFRQDGLVDAAKKAMEIVKIGDYKNPLLLALRSINSKKEKEKVYDKRSPEMAKDWLAVNKLAYVYGAYNISIFGRKYHNSSIYVSKPLPVSSNAKMISLSTNEKHHDIVIGSDELEKTTNQTVSQTARITDIEYYITNKKNPSASDWISILPIEKKYVEGELLLGNDQQKVEEFKENFVIFTLRFKAISSETIVVRRNGIPIARDMYEVSLDGRKIGIKRDYFSAYSIYTVDYKPDDSAYVVNFPNQLEATPKQYQNKNGQNGEYFDSVSQDNTIELTHYPYLFREQYFSYDNENNQYKEDTSKYTEENILYPIIVRVQGVTFKNITNYATNSYEVERLKENNGYTFAQIGKKIIFGHPQNNFELKDIVVDYYYLENHIRMKAILRRNHSGYEAVTPAIYSYQLKIHSFDQIAD